MPAGDDHLLVAAARVDEAAGRRRGRPSRPRGRARSAATSRSTAACDARREHGAVRRRRRAPRRARPRPARPPRWSTSKPRTDCDVRGMPKVEPGRQLRAQNAGTAAASEHGGAGGEVHDRPRHDRAREPRPEALLGVGRLAGQDAACARCRGGRRARAAPAGASPRRRSRRSGSGSRRRRASA